MLTKEITSNFPKIIVLSIILFSCNKSDNVDQGISKTGFPISVSMIARTQPNLDGSFEYYTYELKKGEQAFSNLENLTSNLNLPSRTSLSNILEQTIAFRNGSDINILNLNSGLSYELSDIKSKLGIPQSSYATIINNSSQVFGFYNGFVANGDLGTIFKSYDLKTNSSNEFLTFDKNNKIGGGITNTGITVNDKYLFIQYINTMDPINTKYSLDIYDTKSLKKFRSYTYTQNFGFWQSGKMLFISRLSDSGTSFELFDFEIEKLQKFQNVSATPIYIYGPSNGNIYNSKVAITTINGFLEPEPMIFDFENNSFKLVNGLNLQKILGDLPFGSLQSFRPSFIDLKNEIFIVVLAYGINNVSVEMKYEIIFINFDGEILHRSELPQYEPDAIITIN